MKLTLFKNQLCFVTMDVQTLKNSLCNVKQCESDMYVLEEKDKSASLRRVTMCDIPIGSLVIRMDNKVHFNNFLKDKWGFNKHSDYLIVTDTEATEKCFFNGLCNSLPESIKGKLVIKVIEAKKTGSLIEECINSVSQSPQYRVPWIVFDRDQVPNFDDIIKEAERKGINTGWSNPCFEIWLYAYWGSMPPIEESKKCCSEFNKEYKKKTGKA